jgi:hypothetical protein
MGIVKPYFELLTKTWTWAPIWFFGFDKLGSNIYEPHWSRPKGSPNGVFMMVSIPIN